MRSLKIVLLLMLVAAPSAAQDTSNTGPDARVQAADAVARANSLASEGKFADAIGYYENAIKLDGANHELAYYNLAEVQKVRGNCRAAVLMFQLYASLVGTPNARQEADTGIKGCNTKGWPTLALKVEPGTGAEIFIDEMLAAPTGTFGPVIVPPGSYEVRFAAEDHHPQTEMVTVEAEPVAVTKTLKKMTFFGTITVKVDLEGARVRVFEGPSDKTAELFAGPSPMKEPVRVREGRHFVEVTKDGYRRWIRNVNVGRDVDTEVDVELTRSLPPEISR